MLLSEDGGAPRIKLWVTNAGKPVKVTAEQVAAQLERPGQDPEKISFALQGGALVSAQNIEEPHLFKGTVSVQTGGGPLSFNFAKDEGAVAMTAEQIQAAGVSIDKSGPAKIRTALQLPGEIAFNEDKTAHVVPRVGGVVESVAVSLGQQVTKGQVLAVINSSSVSHCAIKNGVSVDTTMGLTPLEGAVMGTRSGDIDPAIPAFMMQKENLSAKEIDSILNKKSGVLGITGRFTDRRDVIENADSGDKRCQLSLDIEAYRLKKYIGAFMAAVGRLDAVVFTAGVGEMGAAIRERAIEGLEHLGIHLDRERNKNAMTRKRESLITSDDSPVKVYVIPTDEELVFTEDVVAILNGTYTDHMQFEYSFARPDFVRK